MRSIEEQLAALDREALEDLAQDMSIKGFHYSDAQLREMLTNAYYEFDWPVERIRNYLDSRRKG